MSNFNEKCKSCGGTIKQIKYRDIEDEIYVCIICGKYRDTGIYKEYRLDDLLDFEKNTLLTLPQFCNQTKYPYPSVNQFVRDQYGSFKNCPYFIKNSVGTGSPYLIKDVIHFTQFLEKNYNPRNYMLGNELSERELDVLKCFSQGITHRREIAKVMSIQSATVQTHLTNIYSKLQVNDKLQAFIKAVQFGYIEIPKLMEDNKNGLV